ncbi:MAG: dTMP kinase [bacterium]
MAKNGKKWGKLIVIDGIDGSGKSTQIDLLMKKMKESGIKAKMIHFPHYENFFGGFIGHCLSEQYYNFLGTHPKIVSVLYAADRWESSQEIKKMLDSGINVVLDRYVSANQIHQGGKIKSIKKRNDFMKWLDEMEYNVFKIPRPDITLYLDLPTKIVLELLKKRDSSKIKREYLKKKKDVHEADVNFLINSRKSALKLSKEIPNFVKIECSKNNKILSREEIHEMIYEKVKKVIR